MQAFPPDLSVEVMGERLAAAAKDTQARALGCVAATTAESVAVHFEGLAQPGTVGHALATIAVAATLCVATAEYIRTEWAIARVGYYQIAVLFKRWGFHFEWGGGNSN